MKREGNNPKRRVVPAGAVAAEDLKILKKAAKYVGNGHHKRWPADYGFERTNPVPTKSLCDEERVIPLAEAKSLLAAGIDKGMVSGFNPGGFPKFIWSVDEAGNPYESKTDGNGEYHGYPLVEKSEFPAYIIAEWKKR